MAFLLLLIEDTYLMASWSETSSPCVLRSFLDKIFEDTHSESEVGCGERLVAQSLRVVLHALKSRGALALVATI